MGKSKKGKNPDWFTEFEGVIEKVSKKKLWIFGWSLLVTCFLFIATVLWEISKHNAEAKHYNALLHEQMSIESKVELLEKTIDITMTGSLDAIDHFDYCIESLLESKTVADTSFSVGRDLIKMAQNANDAELSVLSSLSFQDTELSKFVDDFKNDFNDLNNSLTKMDQFLAIGLGESEINFSEYFSKVSGNENRIRSGIVTNIQIRIAAFRSLYNRKNEIEKAKLEGIKVPLEAFGIKSKYLVALAGLYIGFFVYYFVTRKLLPKN